MPLYRYPASLLCAAALTMSGCGTYPQTRDAFVDQTINYDGMMKSWMVTDSGPVATPYETVVNNIESRVNDCISTTTQQSMTGANFVRLYQRNNPTLTRVDNNRAELTIQQYHTATLFQPEGGFYILAADITRNSQDHAQLDIYSNTHYQPVIDAVKEWANGSTSCHGVGGG